VVGNTEYRYTAVFCYSRQNNKWPNELRMENGGNDDSRKKRDNTDVVEGDSVPSEEKTKKLRAAKQRPSNTPKITGNGMCLTTTQSIGRMLDLEVSLQQLTRIGGIETPKEYLSQSKWIQFRTGHAGDAASLATCYRKSKTNLNDDRRKGEDSSLEIRLAEGLGDEDSPPSIFALLADIVDDEEDSRILGAAALISAGWEDATSCLKVKMLYVSEDDCINDIADILERRMWLRLSALALMSSKQMVVEHGVIKNNTSTT
jgi:hypothetical protein